MRRIDNNRTRTMGPRNTRRKTESSVLQQKLGISNKGINSLVQNILKEATKPTNFNIFNVVGITIDDNTTKLLNKIDTHIKKEIRNKEYYSLLLDTIACLKAKLFNLLFINEFTDENIDKILEPALANLLPEGLLNELKKLANVDNITLPAEITNKQGGKQSDKQSGKQRNLKMKGGDIKSLYKRLLLLAALATVCSASMTDNIRGIYAGYTNSTIARTLAYVLSNDPMNVAIGNFQGRLLANPEEAKNAAIGMVLISGIIFIGFTIVACCNSQSTPKEISITPANNDNTY
jgi:hypothetical protein